MDSPKHSGDRELYANNALINIRLMKLAEQIQRPKIRILWLVTEIEWIEWAYVSKIWGILPPQGLEGGIPIENQLILSTNL